MPGAIPTSAALVAAASAAAAPATCFSLADSSRIYQTTIGQARRLVKAFQKTRRLSGLFIRVQVDELYSMVIDLNQIEQQGLGQGVSVFLCPRCEKRFSRRHCVQRHFKQVHKAEHDADSTWWMSDATCSSYRYGSVKDDYFRRPRAEIEKEKAENGGFLKSRAPKALRGKRKNSDDDDDDNDNEKTSVRPAAKRVRVNAPENAKVPPQSRKRSLERISDDGEADVVFPVVNTNSRASKRVKIEPTAQQRPQMVINHTYPLPALQAQYLPTTHGRYAASPAVSATTFSQNHRTAIIPTVSIPSASTPYIPNSYGPNERDAFVKGVLHRLPGQWNAGQCIDRNSSPQPDCGQSLNHSIPSGLAMDRSMFFDMVDWDKSGKESTPVDDESLFLDPGWEYSQLYPEAPLSGTESPSRCNAPAGGPYWGFHNANGWQD